MPSHRAKVLAALEELEASQINCGCYVTQVSLSDLSRYLGKTQDESTDSSELSNEVIQNALRDLIDAGEVIEWKVGFYRSRIAETVRILRLLRQRFWNKSFVEAPLLIEDVRVEFRQRRRPDRNAVPAEQAFPSEVPAEIVEKFLQAVQIKSFSQFQQRAIQEIFSCAQQQNSDNYSFIIAGDTGAGKTEAFLFPILLDIASESEEDRKSPGVRAVLVYPRIRLARNQLARLLRYIGSLKLAGACAITVGIQNGDTPRSKQAIAEKWTQSSQRKGYYRVDLLESCIQCEVGRYWVSLEELENPCPRLVCDNCGHEIDSLYLTQESLAQHSPDLLIITDVSLSQWMVRERYTHLWGLWAGDAKTVAPRYLVLDEVHLYEQIKGAHIARLVKRFQARVRLAHRMSGQPDRHPIIIGVSATLNDERAFLSKLLDVQRSDQELYQKLRVIKPMDRELVDTEGRERYIFICPRRLSPTPGNSEYRVNDQTAAIQIIMAVIHNLKREAEWRALAFFDSINDLRQFSSNYDSSPNGANVRRLWQIRTDAVHNNTRIHGTCGGNQCLQRLNQRTLDQCTHFNSGDCWLFAQLGGWNDRLKVADSVYAGSASDLDGTDLIPTSPSLEVGYDDDSIQLVYQHKAPPNVASFIQRRGRAGRNPDDSPIIVTMLWPHRSGDLFYYYHPDALYNPSFDDAPLNANNFNVQRTHTLLAFFDLLACFRRQNLQEICTDSAIVDFTQAGNQLFLISDHIAQSWQTLADPKRPGQTRIVIKHRQTHQPVWLSGGQLTYVDTSNGLRVQGWLAMDKGLTFQTLRRAWERLSAANRLEQYLNDTNIASQSFKQHSTYPFRIQQDASVPSKLLNQFGQKDWHSSYDRVEAFNWVKTYRYIDWMLQGKEDATTLIVHYLTDWASSEAANQSDESTFDLTFALTELLPGNVSYRLRDEQWIHWTPIPKEGESTFLYPEEEVLDEAENIVGHRIVPGYEPEMSDITSQPDSIFGVPHYLDTRFPGLPFMRLRRLRVERFSRPSEQQSSTWYFVPNPNNQNEAYSLQVKPGQVLPANAVSISRRTATRVKSIVVPYIAAARSVERRNIESPLDNLFSVVEGYITEGTAMLGYTRVFYEMQIDVKTSDRTQNTTLMRQFYPPQFRQDAKVNLSPVLIGYSMETHGIAFHINSELLNRVTQRVLDDDDLRLSLRQRMALYHFASYATEESLYMPYVIETARTVIDYWLQKVIPTCVGQPRLLNRTADLTPLRNYYATTRNVQTAEIDSFCEVLTERFFEQLNEVLKKSFKTSQEVKHFIESTILHSLSALLKTLIARLGGVSSDDLIAYADMPILDLVDRSINPRILILDKVEGGSGAIAQAFERLELSSSTHEASEASLWWVLQRDLGQCPIANGEAIVQTVLSQASVSQITDAQSIPTPETLENLLDQLQLKSATETRQILGRTIFSDLLIGGEKVNPTLILKELIELHQQMNSHVPWRYHKEAVVRYAAQSESSQTRPAIASLRRVLNSNGVAQDDLQRELAVQLMTIYVNSCEDGCPVCMSEGSDVEHYQLAPLLRSRRVLSKLKEQLFEQVFQADCLADSIEQLKADEPVEIQNNSNQLDNRLDPQLGIAVVQKIDDSGQLAGSVVIPIDQGKAIVETFTSSDAWEKNWGSPEYRPYRLADGRRVRSRGEFMIAARLIDEGISFDIETPISYKAENGQTKRIHPDFHLYEHNIYIEYWGRDDSEYIESRRFKEAIYQRRGIQVIDIEDADLRDDRFMAKILTRINEET